MKHLRFSLRQLLLLVTLSAIVMLGGILVHQRWARRHVETAVPLMALSVETLRPHFDWIVAEHDVILDVQIDSRTNCAIVTCEYQNRDAAILAIQAFDTSPELLSRQGQNASFEELLSLSDEDLQAMLNRR